MTTKYTFTFARLTDIPQDEILAHMSDPRIAKHLPLLNSEWDQHKIIEFIATKEEYWKRDGLGHWAILIHNSYIGWGGFQKEDDEWDFGLVLKPEYFGLGLQIIKQAFEIVRSHEKITFVTFLLPLSRTRLGALSRLGARFVKEVEYNGVRFLKFRIDID